MKKILSLTLALALCLALAPFAIAVDWSNATDWAVPELEKAQNLGLIPDSLDGKDFAQPINRAEFAAVSVKLYENLSGKTAAVPAQNPFTDTSDPDVLKAYNVGLTAGTSATTFEPNELLSREQAATMLTRVYKAATLSGWTLGTDPSYPIRYTKPSAFADDRGISEWAKDSVYFMASKDVITGTGDNNFSPSLDAPREQAIIIAVRVVDKLKGTSPEIDSQETTVPGVSTGNLTGAWEYWTGGHQYVYNNATKTWNNNYNYLYTYRYYFNSVGTFSFSNNPLYTYSWTPTVTNGKYSVSSGKIYFTDVDCEGIECIDAIYEYKIGSDSDGEYFFFPGFTFDEANVVVSDLYVKFRKMP